MDGKSFFVDVVLASGSSWGLDADMTSIYSTHTLGEDGAVGQIFKTKDNLIKVLCIWQLYDLLAQGCNLYGSCVNQPANRGYWHLKGPGHHTV